MRTINILLLLLLTSCGIAASAPPAPASHPPIDSVDLLLSRTSLSDTEFEQYKLSADTLVLECGTIRRGRFMPASQDVVTLPQDVLAKINKRSFQIFDTLSGTGHKFAEPGSNKNLADPGTMELKISVGTETREVKTSFDSISNEFGTIESRIKKLIEGIRAQSGGKLCNNNDFFGVSQRKL